MPQYSKTLALQKGVDNNIMFQFLDQEQKPIDITGLEITCRIIDSTGTTILLQTALTIQYALTGLAALVVSASDIEDINPQQAYYSIQFPSGAYNYPAYVDQNAQARGRVDIVDSILPSFVPSIGVTIPSGQSFPNLNPTANINTTANTYYSSAFTNTGNDTLTLQVQLIGFGGNVIVQGSTISTADWYDIYSTTYSSVTTDTLGYTVSGFHPFIRIKFDGNVGDVGTILAR